MSVDAVVSKGTKFKVGDGESNEAFTALAEVNSVGLPGHTRAMIDVTDLDSVAMEFVPALRDAGSISIAMNFTRYTYILMYGYFKLDTTKNFQIVFPDTGATTIDFAGYVSDMPGEAPGPNEKITITVTIKITGDITISS